MKYVDKGATISKDGRYRYHLWREWRLHPKSAKWHWWKEDDGTPCLDGAGQKIGEPHSCTFVMLNPSTADGEQDDPTIRRCVSFAAALGYDRLDVLNLFAYRTRDPRELLALNHNDDPIGPDNSRTFERITGKPGIVVCAWGVHGVFLQQNETALGWVHHERKTYALKISKDGHPCHPLYLPAASTLLAYPPVATRSGRSIRS